MVRLLKLGGLLSLLLLPVGVFAQSFITGGIPGCDFATGLLTAACIPNFIAHVIKILFGFVGGICFILILISGYQYALGRLLGGDKTAAVTRLKMAVLGFVVSALSFYLIDFVISTLAGL